jgi:predicted PurR-regulated permease PerM
MTEQQTPLWLRRTVLAGLLGGLLLAGFVVMQPFVAAIAWAAILSYVAWPLHLRMLAWLGGRRTWAALAMTLVLTLVLGLSLLWAGLLLRSEGAAAVREAAALLESGVRLPESILSIALLGPWLQERLSALSGDRCRLGRAIVGPGRPMGWSRHAHGR